MLKPSQFNFMYENNGKVYVYNTFSKSLASITKNYINYFEKESIEENEDVIKLKKNGFLVEQSFDELAFLKYYNNKARYATDYMCITIAPTLACNFDCPYCFENKRQGIMSEDVQIKLIKFVQDKIQLGVKTLEITWYGGEPLLCKNIVRNVTEQIVKIAEEEHVKCKFGMISNGYLIEDDIVNFLEKYHMSIQITLDGMKEKHDARRYLKSGEGTFDVITEKLKLFSGKCIDVYIRMNVDKDNKEDYERLDQFITCLKNPNMILYPAMTEKINERKAERESQYMSMSIYDDFVRLTRQNGVFKFDSTKLPISNDVGKIPDNKCYFCAAELDNSFVIDESGNVYKCWNEVGGEKPCFNLENIYNLDYNNLFRYMGDYVFVDEKCSMCKFIPICFGGCKFHRHHFGEHACAYTEKSVIDYIEGYLLKEK